MVTSFYFEAYTTTKAEQIAVGHVMNCFTKEQAEAKLDRHFEGQMGSLICLRRSKVKPLAVHKHYYVW